MRALHTRLSCLSPRAQPGGPRPRSAGGLPRDLLTHVTRFISAGAPGGSEAALSGWTSVRSEAAPLRSQAALGELLRLKSSGAACARIGRPSWWTAPGRPIPSGARCRVWRRVPLGLGPNGSHGMERQSVPPHDPEHSDCVLRATPSAGTPSAGPSAAGRRAGLRVAECCSFLHAPRCPSFGVKTDLFRRNGRCFPARPRFNSPCVCGRILFFLVCIRPAAHRWHVSTAPRTA